MQIGMKKNLLIAFVILIIIALAVVGFLLTRKNKEPEKVSETFITSAPEPTAEPTKGAEKTDFPILIQNGSGKVGAAGTMKTILEDAGYTISDTTNADSYDHVKTEIRAKSSVPEEFINQIKDEIPSDYKVIIGDALEDDNEADVIVIVGSDGKVEPTPKKTTETQPTTKPTGTETSTTPTPSPSPSPTPTKSA